MVKVVAINGSPKKQGENTALFLSPFLGGMENAGASIKLFYSQEMEIKPCIGDFSCWYKDPGRCFIQDDMQALFQDLFQAEILIFATPLYIPLPGKFQEFINRLCPLLEPILEFKEGRTRARFHPHVEIRKIALVATCGWWELGNFHTLVPIFQNFAEDASPEFAGALLRPHADFMEGRKFQG